MNESPGFGKKRPNETQAEFEGRKRRDEAARPAAAKRSEQYMKDEGRRQKAMPEKKIDWNKAVRKKMGDM